MNKFTINDILLYYDGPEIMIIEDIFSTKYLSIAVDENSEGVIYLGFLISKSNLSLLKNNSKCVRSIIEENKTQAISFLINHNGELISDFIFDYSNEIDNYLPDYDLFINYHEEESDLLSLSKSENCSIIVLGLESNETKEAFQVNASLLSDSLRIFSTLLIDSIKKSISKMHKKSKDLYIDFLSGYTLNVIGITHGSFRIILKPNDIVDIYGNSKVSIGFELLDELFLSVEDEEKFIELLNMNKGHLVGSIRNMATFVDQKNCPLYYKWVSPANNKEITREISINNAKKIISYYDKVKELDGELVYKTGELIKADKKRGIWSLFNDVNNEESSGSIMENTNIDLSGLIIGNLYQFKCKELIEEDYITNTRKVKLKLLEVELL